MGGISVAAGVAAGGSALTAGLGTYPFLRVRPLAVSLLQRLTFEKRKSKQNALPLHSVPRLGSACPNEGIDPWAAATGHPWPGGG